MKKIGWIFHSQSSFILLSPIFLLLFYLAPADTGSLASIFDSNTSLDILSSNFTEFVTNGTRIRIERLDVNVDLEEDDLEDEDDEDDDEENQLEGKRHRKKYRRYKSSPLKGWHIAVVLAIALVFLVILYVTFNYDALTCQKRPAKETIPCYLCDTRIDKMKWNDGSHRRACAIKKSAVLDRMAKPLELHCPNCHFVLRLWPANLGLGFHCDDPECRSPGDEIKNSGFNRLNCFLCDYDICMACANRKICEKQRVKPNAPRKPGSGLSTSAWMIHMNPMVQQNMRSRRPSSTRAASKRKTTKSRLVTKKRSKSVKETKSRSDPHNLDSYSDLPERPLIPKESLHSFLGPLSQNNKRIPKITFKAHSVDYDQATELHTVQVDVEFINESQTSLKCKETSLSVECSPHKQQQQLQIQQQQQQKQIL